MPNPAKNLPSLVALILKFSLKSLNLLICLVQVTLQFSFESVNPGGLLLSLIGRPFRRSQPRVQLLDLKSGVKGVVVEILVIRFFICN